MKVFVTGGNGFIGSRVVKLLLEQGRDVVCLLRPTSDVARLHGLSYRRCDGDVRDRSSLSGMTDADAVIHLACVTSWSLMDGPEASEVIVSGTQNILDAARENDVARIIYVSSLLGLADAPSGQPVDENTSYNLEDAGLPYSSFKHEAEQLCLRAVEEGQDVVIVNPAEVYGPEDTALNTASNLVDFLKSRPVLVCRGGANIAYVDDVANGVVRALERGKRGERYILGGSNLTIRELAELTLEVAGRNARVVTVPNGVLKAVTKMATALHIPLPYNPKVVPYATRNWFAENTKATRDLGVSFRSARDTLVPTIAWLKEAGHLS
jgi:dihydroflavonol-4-reductase